MADEIKRNALGQYLPGSSGNTSGRPKTTFRAEIEKQMEELVTLEGAATPEAKKAVLVRVLLQQALLGDLKAIKMLMDRVDGLPVAYNINETLGDSDLQALADALKGNITERDKP